MEGHYINVSKETYDRLLEVQRIWSNEHGHEVSLDAIIGRRIEGDPVFEGYAHFLEVNYQHNKYCRKIKMDFDLVKSAFERDSGHYDF